MPEVNDIDNLELNVDILKSNIQSNLHIQKVGENEINIVGIENSEQHEFIVEIYLRNIDQCEHLDDKIDLTYMLFDKHKLELSKSSEDGQFHIDQNVTLKFKSSLSDLIVYFRNTFSLPIILTSQENNLKGTFELISLKKIESTGNISFNFHPKGITHLSFGDCLSTLPTSVESFQEIFAAKDLNYQFDSYSSIIFPVNESDVKESNLHYAFSLKLIPHNISNRPTSTTSLLLPHSTLQSAGFSKIASVSPSTKSESPIIEKEVVNAEIIDETFVKDMGTTIPKTFAYTLSLLDCSFNKRPMPGIWQLR